jgi:hypothetical protein
MNNVILTEAVRKYKHPAAYCYDFCE